MEKKDRKKEKIKRENLNLDEKVYLLIYGKTNCIKNISKIIYDKKCRAVDRVIKELKKGRWIEETGYKPPSPSSSALPIDGRTVGKYYCAKVQFLLNSIMKDLKRENVSLTPGEEEILKQYLDGKSFRSLVYDITQKNGKLRSKNINFQTVKQNLIHLSTYRVFTENWFSTRVFRAQPLSSHLLFGKTHPIFALVPKLCEKLMRLDSFSSSTIYQSFDAVSNMIEGTLEPVLKNYVWKLDKHTMEEAHKKGKLVAFVGIPMDPDKPLEWKLHKKKKND